MGVSDPLELRELPDLGREAIDLEDKQFDHRVDSFGNVFGYRMKVVHERHEVPGATFAWDVFLMAQ